MTETLHANIFFLITSLAVIIVTVGGVVLFYYLIPIVRDLRALVGKLRKAGDEVEQDFESVRKDFHSLRSSLKEEGTKSKVVVDLVLGAISKMVSPKRTKKKAEKVIINQKDI